MKEKRGFDLTMLGKGQTPRTDSENSLTGNAFRQLGGNLLEEGTGV